MVETSTKDPHRVRSLGILGGVGACWTVLVVAWLERLGGRAQDDIYIIYRYALNLADGYGFVYNPGERVFGLSEPGVGLVTAAIHRLTGVGVPTVGSALFGFSLLALAMLFLVVFEKRARAPEAILGGTLLLAWSLVWVSHGAGAPLFLLLSVGAAVVLQSGWSTGRRREILAGALAGLAVWVRPDAAAAVGILGLLAWWRAKRLPLTYGLVAAAIIGLGAVSAYAYFGAVLPQTLAAKEAARQAFAPEADATGFWRSAITLLRRHSKGEVDLFLAISAFGTASLYRNGGPAAHLLVLFGAIVALTYSFLNVGLFSWYLLPVLIALIYGFAFGVGSLARFAARAVTKLRGPGPRWAHRLVAVAVATALAAPVVLPVFRSSYRWAASFGGFGRLNTYREAGDWLRLSTPEGARVAAIEIGAVGYHARRPLADLLGLVSPESIPHVARGDLLGALREQDADWVVARSEGRMLRVMRSAWFRDTYEEVIRFPTPDGGVAVMLFRRRS